jgi:hypothetical protein
VEGFLSESIFLSWKKMRMREEERPIKSESAGRLVESGFYRLFQTALSDPKDDMS